MMRIVTGFLLSTLLPVTSFGQFGRTGFPTQEDYCRENPKAAMCPNGRPVSADNPLVFYTPPGLTQSGPVNSPPRSGGSRPSAPALAPQTGRAPASAMALQDWRFSHQSPAMLVSINIASLLQSPMWAQLFSAFGAGGANLQTAAIDKIRSSLGDIGQILVSISPNGTKNSSVLVLAKGNIESPAGAWLRSSPGTQVKRIDAITTLVGEGSSLEFANMRMQSKTPRSSFNPLQQTATREALKYDAWFGLDPRQLVSMASTLGASKMGGDANQALAMLGNLRGLSIGLYVRDQLRMEAVLETASPDMAARMLAAYQESEAKRKQGKAPLEGQIWAVTEGANLRFIEIVDPSHLKSATAMDPMVAQMIGPQIASLMQTLTGSKPQSNAPQSASAAPPKASTPGKIVIQGLDGGPKELPLK